MYLCKRQAAHRSPTLCQAHCSDVSVRLAWLLMNGIALHPGLAALGTLRWALPSPSPFPVAPPAPSEKECRFQVCRTLFMWPHKSTVNYKYLIIRQIYSQKYLQTKYWDRMPFVIIYVESGKHPLCYDQYRVRDCCEAWWSGKERFWVESLCALQVWMTWPPWVKATKVFCSLNFPFHWFYLHWILFVEVFPRGLPLF